MNQRRRIRGNNRNDKSCGLRNARLGTSTSERWASRVRARIRFARSIRTFTSLETLPLISLSRHSSHSSQRTVKELRDLYNDKIVTQFDDRKKDQLNRSIAGKMKQLKNLFGSIKQDIDTLNKQLYKTKHVNLDFFEDVQEWRLVERIVTDLTTRLQKHQHGKSRRRLRTFSSSTHTP